MYQLFCFDMSSVLVTLHGGNFIGGDSSWDKEQTELLKSMCYIVYQIDFPKTNLKECLESIRCQVKDIRSKYSLLKVHVLGRSSGGYLAKILFDEGIFDKAIYIAPVFDPLKRAELVPELGNKSLRFFENQHVPKTSVWDKDRELLLLALNDENVPTDCFNEKQLECAIYLGPKTHSGLLKTTSREFQECINDFLSK